MHVRYFAYNEQALRCSQRGAHIKILGDMVVPCYSKGRGGGDAVRDVVGMSDVKVLKKSVDYIGTVRTAPQFSLATPHGGCGLDRDRLAENK